MDNILLSIENIKTLDISKEVTFSCNKGDIVCLYGENGSGKSLLLKSICGIYDYKLGSINKYIDDDSIGICLQFPEHLLFKDKVIDEALLITGDNEKAEKLLNDIGVDKNINPFHLSDGQKRLLFIYGILAGKDLILLDEPFVSLDNDTKQEVADKIKETVTFGKSVIYTANRLDDTFLTDNIINIEKNV